MYRTSHSNEILFFKGRFIGRRSTSGGCNAQMLAASTRYNIQRPSTRILIGTQP